MKLPRLTKTERAEILWSFVGRTVRIKKHRSPSGTTKGAEVPGFRGKVMDIVWQGRKFVLRISSKNLTRWTADRNVPAIVKAYKRAKEHKGRTQK